MTRRLDRRSFLARIVGTSAALAMAGKASAQARSHFEPARPPLTDADTGTNADPVGNGRGSARSGITDSDSGTNADPAGVTRRFEIVQEPAGVTDADSGTTADPVGQGRGAAREFRNGITDVDSNANGNVTDRPGFGRDNPHAPPRITDSDLGPSADPVGSGRGENP